MRQETQELVARIDGIRGEILRIGTEVFSLKRNKEVFVPGDGPITENHPEAMANIMLAFRHLEDARMRLGKVIQALDGGASCYDAKPRS